MSREQALEILVRCVTQYPGSLSDPRRFKALLLDGFKGQSKRERNLLLLALDQGLPASLQQEAALPALAVARASGRLTREFGIEAGLAHWTAAAWAVALGLITSLSPPAETQAPPRPKAWRLPRPIPIRVTEHKRPPEGPPHPLAMRPPPRKRPPGSR
ncbi:MAG: hypothetical protein ACAI44_30815 [Candidatus Sericytochromatia bacterium]